MAKNKARRPKAKKRRAGGRAKPVQKRSSKTFAGKARAGRWKAPDSWMEWMATAALVAGLWLPSVIVLPGLADEFRLPKLAASEALMLLSVLFLALSKAGFSQYQRSRTLLLVTAPLFVVAVLSVVSGQHPHHGSVALWNFALASVVMLAWGTRGLKVERVLTWLLWPALVATSLLLAQRFGFWRPFDIDAAQARLELTALIGNVGEAALFVSLPFALCWVKAYRCLRSPRQPWRASLWVIAGLLLLLALLFTETATTIAAAGLCLVVLGLLLPMGKRSRALLAAAAVLTTVVVLLIPAGDRFRVKANNLVRGELADLTTGRTDGWNAADYMLAENPVLGVGFGAFVAEFTSAKEAQVADGVAYFDKHVAKSTFSNAHSEALEWAAETGWIGVLALLAVVALGGRRLWRKYLRLPIRAENNAKDASANGQSAVDPDVSPVSVTREELFELQLRRALVGATLVMVVVGALTYFPLRTALLAYPLVILLAALLSESTRQVAERKPAGLAKTETDREQDASADRPGWTRWAAVVVVALLLASSLWLSRTRILASARLLAAESIAGSMAQQKRVYPAVLRQLMAPLEAAGESTPWDERIPLAIGSLHYLLGEHQQAVEWYESSIATAPRPETLFNLGRALLKLDRRDEAIEMFVRSVYLDPLRGLYLDPEVSEEVLAQTYNSLPERVRRRFERENRPRAERE